LYSFYQLNLERMNVNIVIFSWKPNDGDSGQWVVVPNKEAAILVAADVFPGPGLVKSQMFTHLADIRKFRSETVHPGLMGAIRGFLAYADEQGWGTWIGPVKPTTDGR
jgi:hypothetical protein